MASIKLRKKVPKIGGKSSVARIVISTAKRKRTQKAKRTKSEATQRQAKQGGAPNPFDAAAYVDYRQSLVPPLSPGEKEIPQYEAIFLIDGFVSCFLLDKDGCERLGVMPKVAELEALAKRFRKYLTSTISLDEAFGLKGTRRGRVSAKGAVSRRNQAIRVRAMYNELHSKGSLIKQAVAKIAKELNFTESKVKSLIFRNPS